MKFRKFGNTGESLSAVGLGCTGMSFAYGPTNDDESIKILNRSLELGINFWDTADMYGNGHNEELISKVLIAGGTSGIGYAAAKLLSLKNCSVTVLGRNKDKLKEALWELGGNVKGIAVDVCNADLLKETLSKIGQIDHLVIAVSGAKGAGLFCDLDLKLLREGFEQKFFPQLQTAQLALNYLNKNGSITFITAGSSHSKLIGTSGLGAINGGLEIMVPILAKELKPVRVNAVSPGVINTPWWDFLSPAKKEETFKQYAEAIPVGRIGEPEDVATIVETLIKNSYITGQVIAVDGGLSLGK
ncbi:MAG: SDR family oxidoreductase [Bacteroidetes bacterium]|nr:SDR family oxidoreductase [Bacteroidota bacterium]